jgi:hypothetical protein
VTGFSVPPRSISKKHSSFSCFLPTKEIRGKETNIYVHSSRTEQMNLRDESILVMRNLSRLALWLVILSFMMPLSALANRPTAYTLADNLTADKNLIPTEDQVVQQNEGIASDKENDSQSQTATDSSHGSSIDAEKVASSFSTPCMQDISSTDNPPLDSAGKLCSEPLESEQRLGLRFGHQMRTRNSMLGDFDGLMVDYGLGNFALNGIAGFPTVSGNNSINPNNHLFGFSASSRKLVKGWDIGGYMMESQGVGQDSRSALGGAMRYSQANRSLLISADYDLLKRTLSRFIVSGAWKLLPTSTLSTTLDIQQSYLPTPQKSYLQQTIALTDGWKWGLPLDRIKDLSTDSATDVAAFGLSLSHVLSENLKLDSDFSILNISREEDSDSLTTSLSNFNEYYFYLKMTGKGLLLPGDSNTVTFRHNVSDTSRLSSYLLDGSYNINRQWHLTPRFQVEYRDSLSEPSIQWTASPGVKLEYRWRKKSRINFNATGEWHKDQASASEEYHSSYVVSLGYRTDF